MNIEYIKLSPTRNVTVLVKTPVPRERQAELAARLLAHDAVGGEQVGYVEPAADSRAAARLQMMGGEFCGNATMALGAVLARRAGAAVGQVAAYRIEVSGSRDPVSCYILRQDTGWTGTVRMPLPESVETVDLPAGDIEIRAPLVRFEGIAHLIIPLGIGLDEKALKALLPRWNGLIGADALGALLWNAPASFVVPLVYVPSTGTLVRESGCASGTAAIGCWLAGAAGKAWEGPIRQPGGEISVRADCRDGRVRALSITGQVEFMDEGSVEIDLS